MLKVNVAFVLAKIIYVLTNVIFVLANVVYVVAYVVSVLGNVVFAKLAIGWGWVGVVLAEHKEWLGRAI